MSSIVLKKRETTVILFQGDDLDPITERLDAVKRNAQINTPRRLGDADPLVESMGDYDTFMEGAVERAVKLKLVALGKTKYREMLSEHPPRMVPDPDPDAEDGAEVVHEDDGDGFNRATLGDDLIPACIAEGQFDTDAEAAEFIEDLSDGDYSKVFSAALRLNSSLGPDPKARLSSHLEPISNETSPSPERLA